MATIVERIGEYAGSLQSPDIDTKVADYAKRILLDTRACGYGGLESEPAQIVRNGITELDSSVKGAKCWRAGRITWQCAITGNRHKNNFFIFAGNVRFCRSGSRLPCEAGYPQRATTV